VAEEDWCLSRRWRRNQNQEVEKRREVVTIVEEPPPPNEEIPAVERERIGHTGRTKRKLFYPG